ncbi:esterase/lipase/thioesterase family protein [Actinidia rufa]|uniref:protein phosphatase methylesterase-1 n=1 Tax=Actinidia rufa TaxID=165716 RepID=A0A7J0F9C2_9ERIC|nr:esterase/lipase/thioesterase family protein [Actinidia rufa]
MSWAGEGRDWAGCRIWAAPLWTDGCEVGLRWRLMVAALAEVGICTCRGGRKGLGCTRRGWNLHLQRWKEGLGCTEAAGVWAAVKASSDEKRISTHPTCAKKGKKLSFALAANKIKEKARVVAMDLRGHGKSSTENELDLSVETLCNDVIAVLKTMYGDSPPAIVLVGHSMGGSVAVHVAAKKALPSLNGLVVVDVVEGTAMASLMHMQKILSSRMQYFSTVEKASYLVHKAPDYSRGRVVGRQTFFFVAGDADSCDLNLCHGTASE